MSEIQLRSTSAILAANSDLPSIKSINSPDLTTLSSNFTSGPRSLESNIDDTIAHANNLGSLTQSIRKNDSLNINDRVDFYRFELIESSSIFILLSNLSADLDLVLFQDSNGDQKLDGSDWSRASTLGSKKDEPLSFQYLEAGTYFIQVYSYNPNPADISKTPSSSYQLQIQKPELLFQEFKLQDASGDSTLTQVFSQGSLRLNYGLVGRDAALVSVKLEAMLDGGGGTPIELGAWTNGREQDILIDLSRNTALMAGQYSMRAVATLTNGDRVISTVESLQIRDWQKITGTLAPDVIDYDLSLGNVVILGLGGSDTLNLSTVQSSEILSLNGRLLNTYRPEVLTQQAIFGGTSFDILQFRDGRELYFQGLERLNFADQTMALTMKPNDPGYTEQWNLRVSDVDGAWRFNSSQTQQVLLVSIDTGIVPETDLTANIQDLNSTRLIFDPLKDTDNYADSGHGQRSISIMAAIPNNGLGIAGINWLSPVYVRDVYGGSFGNGSRTTFQEALQQALAYARSKRMKVVFQGGIQGEAWLTQGGTAADLADILTGSEGDAFYAIAAGNGGVDLDQSFSTTTQQITSGGVARLQGTHGNLASVGAAVQSDFKWVDGLMNATKIDRAAYSNYGKNLTLMAPTTIPVVNGYGQQTYFSGTSASNPNLAAIASLVWGANLSLTGVEVRNILTETAMDLGVLGRDNLYGAGMVNADAAVRRAYALSRDRELAKSWKIFMSA